MCVYMYTHIYVYTHDRGMTNVNDPLCVLRIMWSFNTTCLASSNDTDFMEWSLLAWRR